MTRKIMCGLLGWVAMLAAHSARADSFAQVIHASQPMMVKIYGAGGVRGLEAYQSGFLISAAGHILTVRSYVLDTDYITVTLNDGQKFEAKLVGGDPRLEIAVLKIPGEDLPHFELAASVPADGGSRVLAFSNLFGVATGDEPSSVQHGIVAVKTRLDARRGVFETPYHGSVYVLDAMTNNPGAAGGALTNLNGELVGLLGKELRNAQNNIWLNYAVPIDELQAAVERIIAGKPAEDEDTQRSRPDQPLDLAALGVILVPNVLERTPPYVDSVRPDSPAEKAGVKADDLVVYVGENLIQSVQGLTEELARLERDATVKLVVMRGQELIEMELSAAANSQAKQP